MSIEEIMRYVPKGEQLVEADNECLQYSGRINDWNKKAPELICPCSSVTTVVTGTTIRVVISNQRSYWNNYLGYIIDGVQQKVLLPESGTTIITLAEGLEDKEHQVMIFKRQDSCHIITIHGLVVDGAAKVLLPAPKPARRIEVYGDSVSAGEVSEAVDYVGQCDPEHNGEYSNSYYSYSWMTARKLQAEIHDIAQGGIALLDNTGWFAGPCYVGMESAFDKIRYNPELGNLMGWEFSRWTPHVVVVAIGQNDNHPIDYMKANYESEVSKHWRRHYQMLIEKLRAIYPKAYIVLTTTILGHDASWDQAIDEVCKKLKDPKVSHFLYKKNGCGTHGHIRIPEAEQMSEELAAYINGLGDDVWES